MAASASTPLELSQAANWYGFSPGMPRSVAMERLRTLGFDDADDPADPEWAAISELGLDLHFNDEGDQELFQLGLSDPEATWRGHKLVEQPLHAVIAALGEAAAEAAWRPENASDYLLDDLEPLPLDRAVRDQDLLIRGTLWLPRRRWGLAMRDGLVEGIAWRASELIPTQTTGPLTEAQLAATRRDDREDHLRREQFPTRRATLPQILLTGIFVLTLIGLSVYAFQEQHAWSTAPTATAKVTAIEPGAPGQTNPVFTVEFVDQYAQPQTAKLPYQEFYVPPKAIGETTEVTYLNMAPIRVKGPAGNRDAVFLHNVPKFIGAFVVYGVLQLLLQWWTARTRG